MKTIEVVAAIIKKDDKILVTKRNKGDFEGLFEFPGGKIEANESKEDALIREIKEELETELTILKYLLTIEYTYPNFHLVMHNYLSTIDNYDIKLIDHSEAKWLKIDELDTVEWIPADIEIVEYLKVNDLG